VRGEAETLLRLVRGLPRGGSHRERLQAFYAPQARDYDRFRERLLHGRAELIEWLAPPPGARVVELGAGTGANLAFFGQRLSRLASLELVDLCPALLDRARERARGIANVRVVEADATTYRPPEPVDCVYFSYALTMIPDWREALDNALAMLRPGGRLGAVDFYVSDAGPAPGTARHGTATRLFWSRWFAHDGVRLDPGHLRRLRALLPDHRRAERRGRVPYLPGLRVPFYLFAGRVPATPGPEER
jgi:S-adenosylmethionine-diacylgycerolhomoserine-N-methlytransferase